MLLKRVVSLQARSTSRGLTIHSHAGRSRKNMTIRATASSAVPAGITLSQFENIDMQNAKESLAVAQQYAGKAAGLAAGAWGSLTSPFAIFGDAWLLNLLFFATLGLLAYSLLVLAPKQ